jgi:DNA-directed RNA polymerase specialized sigma24 family protein
MPAPRPPSSDLRLDPPPTADDLRSLRSLAQRLARNTAEADDLVQETWLAAEQTSTAQPRSRRAWLHGVLRNRGRMLRRGEARRRRR